LSWYNRGGHCVGQYFIHVVLLCDKKEYLFVVRSENFTKILIRI